MAKSGAYGQNLADAMQVKAASSFVSAGTLYASQVAVTEIVHAGGARSETTPLPPEDGLLLMTQMRSWTDRILFEDGKQTAATTLEADAVTIFDLRKTWTGVRSTPVHYLCFYMPRTALDEIGALEGVEAPDEFPNDYCGGNSDPTVASLARALAPAFARPDQANHLFVDHITCAVSAHVLRRYGGASIPIGRSRLSAGQRARAQEAIDANLTGELSIAALSAECGMTPSSFVRAFQATTGLAPHQWLLRRRLEKALGLMRDPRLSLEQVSGLAGFASAAHLRRALRSRHAMEIGGWRPPVTH
jgi:AraC family transcriptional regulator